MANSGFAYVGCLVLDVFPPTVGEGHKVLVGPQPERLLEAGVLYFQDLALNAFNNAKNEFFDFLRKMYITKMTCGGRK